MFSIVNMTNYYFLTLNLLYESNLYFSLIYWQPIKGLNMSTNWRETSFFYVNDVENLGLKVL